ncbi:MAG: hypothetical protein WB809_00465 [Thermoplasmata archaeon]
MTTSDKLRLELDSAVDDWDFHIDRCQECMAEGEHLCGDGADIMERVDVARSRLAFAEQEGLAGHATGWAPWHFRSHSPAVTQNAH